MDFLNAVGFYKRSSYNKRLTGQELMPSKEIVFILASFAGGGSERISISLANSVDRKAFSPVVIVFDGTGPLRSEIKADVKIFEFDKSRAHQAFLPLRNFMSAHVLFG